MYFSAISSPSASDYMTAVHPTSWVTFSVKRPNLSVRKKSLRSIALFPVSDLCGLQDREVCSHNMPYDDSRGASKNQAERSDPCKYLRNGDRCAKPYQLQIPLPSVIPTIFPPVQNKSGNAGWRLPQFCNLSLTLALSKSGPGRSRTSSQPAVQAP